MNLKLRRQQLEMSLSDVAKICDVDRTTIYNWENGITKNIPVDKIEVLAKALRVEPFDIITRNLEGVASADATPQDEFMKLVNQLTPEQKALVLSAIKGILNNK